MKKLLFNPFEKYSELRLLIIGSIGVIASSYIAYLLNARFDGALDMHTTEDVSLCEPFIDNAINIVSLLLLLYISGLIINKKTRIIDILTTILIARLTYCIAPLADPEWISPGITEKLLAINPQSARFPNLSAMDMTALLIMAIISISMLIWYIALLYNGFKTAINGKKPNHIVLFIFSIILAEILSKFLIYQFN